ncbi:MAG: glycosyltransferase family 4 protein [Calditrichaceae bacterium]
MNIAMLAYTFYESDNRVRRYSEALAERGDHVDVYALARNGNPSREVIKKVNLFRIQKRTANEKHKAEYLLKILFFFFNSMFRLTVNHFRKKYDVIHVHSVPDFEVFATLFAKLTGAKIILDIHDIVPEFYASKFNVSKKSPLFKLLVLVEKTASAFSDHVIISNHLWYETLKSRSVKNGKCTAIINYPDPNSFYRIKKKGSSDKFILIYPGSLNWHQGLDIAIRAFARIHDQIDGAEFHIYGIGETKPILEKMADEMGLSDKVLFMDILPTEGIAAKMAEASLGIVPKRAESFGNEAFSTKILEFMSMGVPVIVSKTKIDQYYFDDDLVLFFEPENDEQLAEKITRLYKENELRDSLVKNGLKYISENNWGVKKDIYLRIVDELIAKKK